MQKLLERNTYTPTNTSLIRSNCGLSLNNPCGVMDSVIDLKTSDNSPEENLLRKEGQTRKVSVQYVYERAGNSSPP